MKKEIPTAYEFLETSKSEMYYEDLIKFAKLHVKAALEAVVEKSKINSKLHPDFDGIGNPEWINEIDKDSILNAYPLTNIK